MRVLGQCRRMRLDQAAQPAADFLARWRLAGAQDHGHRAAGRGVVNVDRQKAALVVMGVPFRQFLAAMHDIERIVDVQNHRGGRLRVASAPDIDQRIGEPDDLFQRRRVLPARDGGLRTQIGARIGKPPAGELEGWIGPQKVEIVAVGIAAGNRKHARSEHILDGVGDVRRVARIVDQSGKRSGDRPAALGKRKQASRRCQRKDGRHRTRL